jgi:hypothetical protein
MFYVARNACIHATELSGMRPHLSAAFCGVRKPSLTGPVPAQYRQIGEWQIPTNIYSEQIKGII